MALGLKARVILAFGVLSLAVALLVSLTAYYFARTYLVTQRESSGITRAALDARAVFAALSDGADPGDAVAAVPVVGGVQRRSPGSSDTWYTTRVPVPPTTSSSLLDVAGSTGSCAAAVRGRWTPLFGVAVARGRRTRAVPSRRGRQRAATAGTWWAPALDARPRCARSLGGHAGAAPGAVAESAVRIAPGISLRVSSSTSDPDLEQLTTAFNEMADGGGASPVNGVANVSHVSPRTGTRHGRRRDNPGRMPTRDAGLVEGRADLDSVDLHRREGRAGTRCRSRRSTSPESPRPSCTSGRSRSASSRATRRWCGRMRVGSRGSNLIDRRHACRPSWWSGCPTRCRRRARSPGPAFRADLRAAVRAAVPHARPISASSPGCGARPRWRRRHR